MFMNMDNIKAINIINEVFNVDLVEEDFNKKVTEVIKWDSFMITSLMASVLEQYGKMIDLDGIFKVVSIGDLISLINYCIEK